MELPGRGDSSPCVWGDRVFVTASISEGGEIKPGDPAHPKSSGPMAQLKFMRYGFQTMCFNRITGQQIWAQTLPFDHSAGGSIPTVILFMGEYANATPASDGTVVCTFFGMQWLLCYDMQGALKWRRELPDHDPMSSGADGASPIIVGDRVILVRDGSAESYLAAFKKETGEPIWKIKREEDSVSWTTPIVVDVGDKRQVVVNGSRVRGYDFESGAMIWECGGMAKSVIPTIVAGQGMVIAASKGDTGALSAIRLGRTGDLTKTDAVVWKSDRGMPHVPTPILYGNELYVADDKGILACFDAATGKTRYDRQRIPGVSSLIASPVAADGKIYFLSEEGTMAILKAGEQFEVLGKNEIPDHFRATPALVDGAILLRSNHYLYCIGAER